MTHDEIAALIERIPAGATPGPWMFEPHPMFGSYFENEDWPFGYLSTSHQFPIFALEPLLGFPIEEMTASAALIALAPDLASAVRTLAAENERLREALERLGAATPESLNVAFAFDALSAVRAIANTALTPKD